jgi:cysteine desulfurase
MARPRIYLDNAATTAPDPRVVEEMLPYWQQHWGNPSSLHTVGREARVAIERARKQISSLLGASPAEIFFTSGGTEADNTVLRGAVEYLGIRHLVTSRIEHHAVLHTAEHLAKLGLAQLHFVELDEAGFVLPEKLDKLLASLDGPALVSMMHGNNEIGNLIDLKTIGDIVHKHNGYFHSDTVQSIGHTRLNLSQLPVDYVVGAAHKFHGPKGIGFLYVNNRANLGPYQTGGAQERNMRGGTENVAGIVGMAKALELAYADLEADNAHIRSLKERLKEKIKAELPEISFHGGSGDMARSLIHVVNLSLPAHPSNEMLLLRLDMEGICASGGSACSSGAEVASHVLEALYPGSERAGLRISFSKHNTLEEIDQVIACLVSLVASPNTKLQTVG